MDAPGMSLKQELEIWASALKAYEAQEFSAALELFSQIASTSKIRANLGLILATIGEHEVAIEQFKVATDLDEYLAIAYFQSGVSNFLLGQFQDALNDFELALESLRGNQVIHYHQIGLAFDLYSAEVIFNRGLAKIFLGDTKAGLADLESARQEKVIEAHDVIDEAIRVRAEGYTVFSIPVGIIYRPSENKLKNSRTRDYMGKAKLISDGSNEAGQTFIAPSRFATAKPLSDESPEVRPISAESNSEGSQSEKGESDSAFGSVRSTKQKLVRSNSTPIRVTDPGSMRGPQLRRLNTAPAGLPRVPGGRTVEQRMPSRIAAGLRGFPAEPKNDLRVTAPLSAPMRGTIRRPSLGSSGPKSVQTVDSRWKIPRQPMPKYEEEEEEEEEEGYVSDEYDGSSVVPDMTIMVKLHYHGDVRGLTVKPYTTFYEFQRLLATKFNKNVPELVFKFKDEDGVMISLMDESDFELAIATAGDAAKGKINGKLEVWCTDT